MKMTYISNYVDKYFIIITFFPFAVAGKYEYFVIYKSRYPLFVQRSYKL